MAVPGLGHKSYLQVGREAVWGTAVAATHRFGVKRMSIEPVIGAIRDEQLNDKPFRDALYQGGLLYKGTVAMNLTYAGQMLLFDGVFGTATFGSNGGATSGVGPYTHTFNQKALLNSYTLQMIEGNILDTKCQRVDGAKIVGMRIRGESGTGELAILEVEFDFLAKDKTVNIAPTGSLTIQNTAPVLYHQATTVDNGIRTSSVSISSFEIELPNPVHEDRFYLGAVNIDEPIRSNFSEPKWRFSAELQSDDELEAADAFTTGTPQLIFTSGTTTMTFEMGEAKLIEYSNPVSNYGRIMQSFTWEGSGDGAGTESAFRLINVNAQATITTVT